MSKSLEDAVKVFRDATTDPKDVAKLLRLIVRNMREYSDALASAHQFPGASQPWAHIARELEKTAFRIEMMF